jgi:hypothetical protein
MLCLRFGGNVCFGLFAPSIIDTMALLPFFEEQHPSNQCGRVGELAGQQERLVAVAQRALVSFHLLPGAIRPWAQSATCTGGTSRQQTLQFCL